MIVKGTRSLILYLAVISIKRLYGTSFFRAAKRDTSRHKDMHPTMYRIVEI